MGPCTDNTGRVHDVHAGQSSWASSDSMEVGLGDRDGETNRTGMNVSMLPSKKCTGKAMWCAFSGPSLFDLMEPSSIASSSPKLLWPGHPHLHPAGAP